MKYRIMTKKGEWLYGEVSVLVNRLVIVLSDTDGHQMVDPSIMLREETLGKHTGIDNFYEGDILLNGGGEACEITRDSTGAWVLRDPISHCDAYVEEYSGERAIGNIHENPELMRDMV